jgi:hypothetical protein
MEPLRDLIAAIPYVGESIQAIVAEPATKIAERRLQYMFVQLHRAMRVLDESSIQKDFLETEEWAGLVRRAVARSTQIRDCHRLSAVARILAGAATTGSAWAPAGAVEMSRGDSRAAPVLSLL